MHQILSGQPFNRWWSDTKRNHNLHDDQIERYVVNQGLFSNPLERSIHPDPPQRRIASAPLQQSIASDHLQQNIASDKNDSDRVGADDSNDAGPSTLYENNDTNQVGQDVDADPQTSAVKTEYAEEYEEVSRPRSRRPPPKDYASEIEKVERAQAREDSAYNPNKGPKGEKAKGKRGGRAAGGSGRKSMNIVSQSIAMFDQLEAGAGAGAEPEPELEPEPEPEPEPEHEHEPEPEAALEHAPAAAEGTANDEVMADM